jgi:molecular chaperone GrpE (heat shock protein)
VHLDADPGPAADAAEGAELSTGELAVVIESLRHDIERLVPHVLNILRRDENEHRKRADALAREAREVATWPLAMGVHTFLERMRRTDMSRELLASIEVDLGGLLEVHGFSTFGRCGEAFDPNRHEAAGVSRDDDRARMWAVDEVIVPGLQWLDRIVQRAVVTVGSGSEESGQKGSM